MSQLNYRVHQHKVHWSALDKPVITSYVLNNLRPFVLKLKKKKKNPPQPNITLQKWSTYSQFLKLRQPKNSQIL